MATNAGEEPPTSPVVVNTLAEAIDARLMVARSREDCQKLKNLLIQQDAATMVVVVASSKKPSAAEHSSGNMHPMLLAAAYKGNSGELNFLLNREDNQGIRRGMEPQIGYPQLLEAHTRMQLQDVEEGVGIQAPSAASLLEGITVNGDTALHVVAASGDKDSFINCASLIYDKDNSFLCKRNQKGDTPLHCAVRAGKSKMVSHLITLARSENGGDNIVKDLLRKENRSQETALHDAVRIGHKDLVEALLTNDPELARFPTEGSSPMYLAIMLENKKIAETLHDKSKENDLSYLGPHGQNVSHAAVLRGAVLTRKVLGWKKDLAAGRDENGSTPLHLAAHLPWQRQRGSVCSQLLKANPAALYQPDRHELFPIHVAASVGATGNVILFLKTCPSSAGLRDAKGRTFLHVAVEKKQVGVVGYACRNRSLAWILNMQDNDGNTALHLAVQAGSLRMFTSLFGNQNVNLNLANTEGKTPRDISEYKIPPGLFMTTNPEIQIRASLRMTRASLGVFRKDHFTEIYEDIHGLKSDYERKQLDNMKDFTQTQIIGSVLIATVTFGASFALPGGLRADDHTNGGTPTLAGRYSFDAFLMANTLAFVFSSAATLCLVRAGSPAFNRRSRAIYSFIAFYFTETSVTCLVAAFSLGVFVMLSSVAYKTAIAICVLSSLVVICNKAEFWLKQVLHALAFWIRMGPIWTLYMGIVLVVGNMIGEFWPLLLIFSWAAYGRSNPTLKVEPPAQPPSV